MKRIVVIGCGFAGTSAAARLSRFKKEIELTVIDKNRFFNFLPLLPDVAGPEVLTFKEMLREWKQARGIHKLVLPLPIPGKFAAALRHGIITAPDARVGKLTWAQWCRRRYSHARQTGERIGPIYSLRG